jgi:hypothetical protein
MEVVGNDSASAYVLHPFDLHSFQFQKSEFKLKSDGRGNLSQAGRRTEGIQVDIRTAELQGNLRFKYEMSVVEFGIVGNADYEKAVTKILTTGTKYRIGLRNVAVYRNCGHRVRIRRYHKQRGNCRGYNMYGKKSLANHD